MPFLDFGRACVSPALLTLVAIASGGCSGVATGTGESGDGGSSTPASGGDGKKSGVDQGPASDSIDALFGAPTTAASTPGSLYGLWAGTANGLDARLKLEPTRVTVAVKCRDAVGVQVSGRVDAEKIQITESKYDTRPSCGINVVPVMIAECAAPGATSGTCFTLQGSSLTINGYLFSRSVEGDPYPRGHDKTFTKLSD